MRKSKEDNREKDTKRGEREKEGDLRWKKERERERDFKMSKIFSTGKYVLKGLFSVAFNDANA